MIPATVHSARELSNSLLAMLRATGLKVGDAVRPPKVNGAEVVGWINGVFQAYGVLYPLVGGVASGSLENREEDFEALYQITCVGESRQSAEWVSDKARVALMSAEIVIPDRKVLYARTDMAGGIQRDDDEQPPLYYLPDRYRIVSTPDA